MDLQASLPDDADHGITCEVSFTIDRDWECNGWVFSDLQGLRLLIIGRDGTPSTMEGRRHAEITGLTFTRPEVDEMIRLWMTENILKKAVHCKRQSCSFSYIFGDEAARLSLDVQPNNYVLNRGKRFQVLTHVGFSNLMSSLITVPSTHNHY